MDYGIDLLIISPTDSHELTPVVREAYSKIPVIVLDRAVEGYDYSLFIGPDNERLGREAGSVVSEMLGKRPGTVLEIQGRSGSPPVLSRSQGLREVLAKHPNIRIVDSIVADWLRDAAEDKVAEYIRVIPDIDVIFAQNDMITLHDLPDNLRNIKEIQVPEKIGSLEEFMKRIEKEYILRALESYNYDKEKAASALNLGLSTLYRKIKDLEIEV